MGFFQDGVPAAVWGDVFLAAGLVAMGFELWTLATKGVGADFLGQARDAAFFISAVLLLSLGASMKRQQKKDY
ncbi:MAG: hypothetical protein WC792_06355 [Candidatus Micrarchaeia archaeon]